MCSRVMDVQCVWTTFVQTRQADCAGRRLSECGLSSTPAGTATWQPGCGGQAGRWDTTHLKLPTQQGLCQGRLQLPLDGTLDWPGTIHWIVPDACQVPEQEIQPTTHRQHGVSDLEHVASSRTCPGMQQGDSAPSPEVDVTQCVLVCL